MELSIVGGTLMQIVVSSSVANGVKCPILLLFVRGAEDNIKILNQIKLLQYFSCLSGV